MKKKCKIYFAICSLLLLGCSDIRSEEIRLASVPPGLSSDLLQINWVDKGFKVAYRAKRGNQELWVVDPVRFVETDVGN